MTLEEFSFEFDVMYNNITSNQAPGLSELEKSVFLTQAQEVLVKQYYKGNSEQAFENTEEVNEYLNSLVTQAVMGSNDAIAGKGILLSSNLKSTFFNIPPDLMFITYESAVLNDACNTSSTKDVLVVPTTQDEFYSTYTNPFRGPSKNRVLRLLSSDRIELISTKNIEKYLVRYIKYPKPIVLPGADEIAPYSDYPEGLNTELPESLHRNILLQAVALAQATWAS